MLVARCNRRADRARGLPVLGDRIEEMKVLINLGKEVNNGNTNNNDMTNTNYVRCVR